MATGLPVYVVLYVVLTDRKTRSIEAHTVLLVDSFAFILDRPSEDEAPLQESLSCVYMNLLSIFQQSQSG